MLKDQDTIMFDELDIVTGGRSAPTPSQDALGDKLHEIDTLLDGGGGGMNQMMTMFMQMMMQDRKSGPSQITSPGLMGALFGGTTTVT